MQLPEGTTYLGDGVYANHDGYQVRLMVSNGLEITDEVYLDPFTLGALIKFLKEKGYITK